jgi:hypothetical protein
MGAVNRFDYAVLLLSTTDNGRSFQLLRLTANGLVPWDSPFEPNAVDALLHWLSSHGWAPYAESQSSVADGGQRAIHLRRAQATANQAAPSTEMPFAVRARQLWGARAAFRLPRPLSI